MLIPIKSLSQSTITHTHSFHITTTGDIYSIHNNNFYIFILLWGVWKQAGKIKITGRKKREYRKMVLQLSCQSLGVKKNMIKEIFITQQGVEGEIKLLLKQGIKQMACAMLGLIGFFVENLLSD